MSAQRPEILLVTPPTTPAWWSRRGPGCRWASCTSAALYDAMTRFDTLDQVRDTLRSEMAALREDMARPEA